MFLKNTSILFLTLLMVSCHQDFESESTITTQTDDPQIIITTEVTGQVVDSNGAVQDDYTINVGNSQIIQGKNHFLETLEGINKRGQYMEVFQDGEFKAFAFPLLLENDINVLNIHLFPGLEFSQEELDQEIMVHQEIGLRINALKNNSGQTHSGTFTIGYRNLNDQKYNWQLGSYGFDKSNKLVSLKNLNSFYFEISDDLGEELSLDSDMASTFHYSGSTAGNIALFYFNITDKKWELVNDIKGSSLAVSKSGYYMVATYTDGIFTEGQLLLEDTGISYQKYKWEDNDSENYGYTTVSGKFLAVAPALSDLEYKIVNPCGDILNTIFYSSPEKNVDDLLFNINNDDNQFFNLNTSVLGCDEEFSSQAAVNLVLNNGNNIYAFNNSDINTWLSVCNMSFEISGYNLETENFGPVISWNTSVDEPIQYLSDCPDHSEGFSYMVIRNDNKFYPAFNFSRLGNKTILESQDGEIKLLIEGDDVGIYETEKLNIKIYDISFGNDGYAVNCENSSVGCGIEKAYVSHYEEMSNGWIRLSFEGKVWMQTLTPAAAGDFSIEGIILCKAN